MPSKVTKCQLMYREQNCNFCGLEPDCPIFGIQNFYSDEIGSTLVCSSLLPIGNTFIIEINLSDARDTGHSVLSLGAPDSGITVTVLAVIIILSEL